MAQNVSIFEVKVFKRFWNRIRLTSDEHFWTEKIELKKADNSVTFCNLFSLRYLRLRLSNIRLIWIKNKNGKTIYKSEDNVGKIQTERATKKKQVGREINTKRNGEKVK